MAAYFCWSQSCCLIPTVEVHLDYERPLREGAVQLRWGHACVGFGWRAPVLPPHLRHDLNTDDPFICCKCGIWADGIDDLERERCPVPGEAMPDDGLPF